MYSCHINGETLMADVRVQFILKRREDYSSELHGHHKTLSTGLYNSVSFLDEMLNDCNVTSEICVVEDNNSIDRAVTRFKPTHCIIEALWVVPSKFAVLTKLHPKIKWIVRLHSEMPFIANEGIAMDWLADYVRYPQLMIGVNAPRMLEETRTYLRSVHRWDAKTAESRVIYMPNFYPQTYTKRRPLRQKGIINVGCFGAVRPLKNHLLQAVAAVKYADSKKLQLRFHINGNRLEMKGEPVLNNLKGMFQQLEDRGHALLLHDWRSRPEFLDLCAEMDVGMQVSFSETFNIVGADIISVGVPRVPSMEIPWANELFAADPVDSVDIANKIARTMKWGWLNTMLHKKQLTAYTNTTRKVWLDWLTKQGKDLNE